MKKFKAVVIIITILAGIAGLAIPGSGVHSVGSVTSRENLAAAPEITSAGATGPVAIGSATPTLTNTPVPEATVTEAPAPHRSEEFIYSGQNIVIADENKPGKTSGSSEVVDFSKLEIPEVELSKDNDKEDPNAAKMKSETQSVTIQQMIANLTTPTPVPTKTPTAAPAGTDTSEVIYVKEKKKVEYTKAGIDVSRYQGNIDWEKVAASGVTFAIIQCGYRGWETGKMVEDNMARKNIEGALAAGVEVGLYFFSQAITEKEAAEEAKFCVSIAQKYNITYPIFMDLEEVYANYGTRPKWRAHNLPHDKMNAIGRAFMDCVKYYGYTPGLYGNKNAFTVEWDMDKFTDCFIWVAHYGVSKTTYTGHYDMWQYTDSGKVDGIGPVVDLNIQYCVKYEEVDSNVTATPTATTTPETGPDVTPAVTPEDTPTPSITPAAETEFAETDDVVVVMIANGYLNLRSAPDSSVADNVQFTAQNGEKIHRTGISAEWSRLDYNDQVVYAKNDYLISESDPTDPLEGITDTPTVTEEATTTPGQDETPEV